jgi:hypothetical protein
MNKFINKTVISKNDITEINMQIYLKTPLYLVLYAVCILSIGARLIDYFVYNQVNLTATIPFLLALIAMVFVYITNSRNMYNQSLDENNNPIEYTYTAEESVIKLETSDGKKGELEYKMIYKTFESKNCFAIRGRNNSFYILRKDAFVEGDFETFKAEIKAFA